MHRTATISARRRRPSPALIWARTIAACAIVFTLGYLIVMGALATAVTWGWTA